MEFWNWDRDVATPMELVRIDLATKYEDSTSSGIQVGGVKTNLFVGESLRKQGAEQMGLG